MIKIDNSIPTHPINVYAENLSHGFRQSLTGSDTAEGQSIDATFNVFMSKLSTSKIQNDTAYDVAEHLIKAKPSMSINFELATEELEIVFVAQNDDAQNILVLDEDGDIMISHLPFKGEGWRSFYNYNEVDLESVVYKFLSL